MDCHVWRAVGVKPECEPLDGGEPPDVKQQGLGARSLEKTEVFEELFRISYRRLARLLFRITRDFARRREGFRGRLVFVPESGKPHHQFRGGILRRP